MKQPSTGLRDVPTESLRRLLRAVYRAELACPLDPAGLACHGLQDRSEALLGALRGLDERSVRAVLVCVLAERLDA